MDDRRERLQFGRFPPSRRSLVAANLRLELRQSGVIVCLDVLRLYIREGVSSLRIHSTGEFSLQCSCVAHITRPRTLNCYLALEFTLLMYPLLDHLSK